MPSTQDAYLHTITGGFDDQKRKAVRKIFQGDAPEDEEPPHNTANYDLIVGAVEEINAVGVRKFKISHVRQILSIFGVSHFLSGNVDDYIEAALAVIGCGRSKDTFTTVDTNKLEGLRLQHCSDEKRDERIKALSHHVTPQAGLVQVEN